jgi:hypothetical protein
MRQRRTTNLMIDLDQELDDALACSSQFYLQPISHVPASYNNIKTKRFLNIFQV